MLKVLLLNKRARLPERNNPTDAGLDIFSTENISIPSKSWQTISTGISISLPDGFYAKISPRSGLAAKHGIDVFAGIVDSSYRGEVKVVLYNAGVKEYNINIGDKIAQLVIHECKLWDSIEVFSINDLGSSERGEKGFNSSGY
jgi:dUTP pyrophosphatase